MRFTALALAAALLTAGNAVAQFDLQITEIFPGNEPGANLTNDFFEITNFGDATFTFGVDGDLLFDDESQDPVAADLLLGVTSIEPGESVIFIETSDFIMSVNTDIADLVAQFPSLTGQEIGAYVGSGLSQDGDGVTLFLTAPSVAPTAGDIIDFEAYPDANAVGGQSFDVGTQLFSGTLNNGLTSTGLNDENQPIIATPGFLGEIPEPTSAVLFVLASCGAVARRRR